MEEVIFSTPANKVLDKIQETLAPNSDEELLSESDLEEIADLAADELDDENVTDEISNIIQDETANSEPVLE